MADYVREGQHISLSQACADFARKQPHRVAIVCDGVDLSWSELHLKSNALAHSLSMWGVREGDFVAVRLNNSIDFVAVCMAVWKLGATPQPVSTHLTPSELSGLMELTRPTAIVSAQALSLPWTSLSIEELLSIRSSQADLPDKVSRSYLASSSGGSTGRPKIIVSGQMSVVNSSLARAWRLDGADVMLMPAPLCHTSPFMCAFLGLFAGARLVLMSKFKEEEALRLIGDHKVSWAYMVPTMMSRISKLPAEVRAGADVSSLRTLWHLAAPCPPWVKQDWIDWLGPEVVWELYGGADGKSCTIISGTEWLDHQGSVGRVMGGTIRILDEQGVDVPRGTVGEIYMRGRNGAPSPHTCIGGVRRSLGEWESIGDLGHVDADGYLYLADRRVDMILVGGTNVYPAEVEAALDEHPMVQSSAVIGLPDDDLGNFVHAIVQTRGLAREEELHAHLRHRLAPYKRPRSFELVDYPLRDDAGKVRRFQLREDRLGRATTRP